MPGTNTIPSGKLLLAASTGGHLAQLVRLSGLIGAGEDSLWVTFENAQSRSLLAGRRHLFVPYIQPRDLRGALGAFGPFRDALKAEEFDGAVSTGAAIAVPALLAARASGIPACYIESVSRVQGPSLSGRILERVPGVSTFTQYEAWNRKGWSYGLSLFDTFAAAGGPRRGPLRVFVTLGTISPYRFDSLADRLIEAAAGADVEFVWQLGCTTRDDLPGRAVAELSAEEFDTLVRESDVVVSHAGVGTCLHLLELGVKPVLVPRRSARGEHVDDHQAQIAAELGRRGLVVTREVGEVTFDDLLSVAS